MKVHVFNLMLICFISISSSIAIAKGSLSFDALTIGQPMKDWAARHGMSPTEYQQIVTKFHNDGFRLTYVDAYDVNGKVMFAALWKKGNVSGIIARHHMSSEKYQQEVDKHHKNGYRLIHVDGYSLNGKATYAAIWQKKSVQGLLARHGLTAAQYQNEATKYARDGYKLMHISGYALNRKAYYAAIWKKADNSKQITRHGLSSQQYQNEVNTHWKNGYRILQVDSYDVNGKVYYAAIFEKVPGRFSARHQLTPINYQLQVDNHYYQGFIPISVSGHDAGEKAGYAAAFKSIGGWKRKDVIQLDNKIQAVMKNYSIPGASIAIVKDGKLVYAKGYGYGNKEKKEIASATSLYRVASISKPITAVAIMKLREDTDLRLNQKVLGPGTMLGTGYGKQPYSNREKQINIRHLLEHRAGGNAWDNNKDPNPASGPEDTWGAPMFQQINLNRKELIGWVLDDRNPSDDVNSVFAYSNFGYCLLGRVIAKKSGMTYQAYVRNNVLAPCGIKDMYIGAKEKSNRRYKEVVYYGSATRDPYALKPRRMDSHGGWIASAVDLMRFAVRVDGDPIKKDILTKESIEKMLTNSAGGSNYAKGWDINNCLMKHGGRMTGTRARLKLKENGIYFVYLVNKYDGENDPNGEFNTALEDGIANIKFWPDIDLF